MSKKEGISTNPNDYYEILGRKLEEYFDLNELRTLCLHLGINPENVANEKTLTVFINELIVFCYRNGKLKDLIEKCKELRPRVSWPEGAPPILFHTTNQPVLGEFATRAIAFFVDYAVFLSFSVIVGLILFGTTYPDLWDSINAGTLPNLLQPDPRFERQFNLTFNIITIGASWLYFALMESSKWQGTLGKKLVGLKVVDANGEKIGFKKATVRYLVKFAFYFVESYVCLSIAVLGAFLVIFNDNRQAIHDKVAKTFVFKERTNSPSFKRQNRTEKDIHR